MSELEHLKTIYETVNSTVKKFTKHLKDAEKACKVVQGQIDQKMKLLNQLEEEPDGFETGTADPADPAAPAIDGED